jgi:CO/xanthine dehydrogenase Mo-binding subunit
MDENPVPTRTNPLGVKGAGKAGNVGALAAIMNAVADALTPSVSPISTCPHLKRSGARSALRTDDEE